jgi:hypothetical protein
MDMSKLVTAPWMRVTRRRTLRRRRPSEAPWRIERMFDTMPTGRPEGSKVTERYVVRETEYGFGIWDLSANRWWIPRLEMTQQDAEQIAAELNSREET